MADHLGVARCARNRVAHADLEMKLGSYTDDLPSDDTIIALEETDSGWRGLTAKGELLNVRSRNGHKAAIPDGDVVMMRGDVVTSRRPIDRAEMRIDDYMTHYDRALTFTRQNQHVEALNEIDGAIAMAPTLFARFNRAMIFLALGRWREGFEEYRACEAQAPLTRPAVASALAAGLKPWAGEDLAGKRLLLLHAHGFGDTIMTLRYVPRLQAAGADVILKMPDELKRLAMQCAPVTDELRADFFCPILHLVGMVPPDFDGSPYLCVDPGAIERWRARLGSGKHIGIAWTPAATNVGDYPRAIPFDRLVAALGDVQLHSVQKHAAEEARALDVCVHELEDFADCAALMLALDRVVSVDTAALHLAGAIGHPRVDGLLSHWASWRWLAPWYSNVMLRRQSSDGDWDSALAQITAPL
jgi:hypothetical protein